jgi:hypothetical protein
MVHHRAVAGAIGILAGCIALVLLVLIAFNRSNPSQLHGGFALLLVVAYGWAGTGMATGGLLARRLRGQLRAAQSAFLGTLIAMGANDLGNSS